LLTEGTGGTVTKAEIRAGICGFNTRVEARSEGLVCALSIESECDHVSQMGELLTEVDPFREITYRGEGPLTFRVAAVCCKHPACPVPVGILKAIEVESGLALPADVAISLTRG
jgi:hypothetical protein